MHVQACLKHQTELPHDKIFKCDYCDFILNIHKSKIIGGKMDGVSVRFQCEYCEKKFLITMKLYDHK